MKRAVVVGSGPNGLVGAIVLARAGFAVQVLEAAEVAGGGTRTEELTLPGFRHDVCSAIHPLVRASPAFREVGLEVDLVHPDAPAAHPLDDGTAILLERSLEETVAGLGAGGAAYERLVGPIVREWSAVAGVVLEGPSPRSIGRALRALGLATALRTLRAGLAPAAGLLPGERAAAFFAGHCAHSMLPLERRPAAGFGLILAAMGHVVGWPFPRGGAQAIAEALVTRLADHGGEIVVGSQVDHLPRADVVLADVSPRELVRIARGRLPARYARALLRFRHGPGAFKLDWALDGPIPWLAETCARAGTVHLGGGFDEIAASERAPWARRHAERPFVLLAQHTRFDASRAPAGKHTAWAYCHVPNGSSEDMTDRIEGQVERFAPGFRDRILARHAMGSAALEAHDRNLVGGDLNGGAMDLGQLLFRPTRTLVPYRTPLRGVYLCSSSTPPGGGVHGMCGLAAAELALRDRR